MPKMWQDLLPGPVHAVPLHQARGGGGGLPAPAAELQTVQPPLPQEGEAGPAHGEGSPPVLYCTVLL